MKTIVSFLLSLCLASFCKAQIGSSQVMTGSAPTAPAQTSPANTPAGDVNTTNSVTNASGGQSVLLLNSRVNPSGSYGGSVPGKLTNESMRLSLHEVLSLALQRNLGGINTHSSLLAAEGRRQSARSELLPHSDGFLFATDKQGAPLTLDFTPPQYPRVAGPYHYFDLGGTVDQVLFDLTRSNNLRSASADLKAAVFDSKDARDLILLAACGQYLQVNADYARVLASEARVRAARRIYERAKDQLNAGVLNTLDTNRTQVQLQVEQLRLRSLQSEYDIDRLTLGRLAGIPTAQRFVLTDEFVFQALKDWQPDKAIEQALRERDDLHAALARLESAVSVVKAARSRYLPTVTVQGSYDVIGTTPVVSNGFLGIAGQVNFPIFEHPRIKAEIQQAQAAVELRQAEAASLREQISFEVQRVFLQLNAAADQVAVAASNIDLAQQTLRQSGERLEAGVADTVEVVQAEQQMAQADDDYISAVFTHNLAKVVLARTLGDAQTHVQAFLQRK